MDFSKYLIVTDLDGTLFDTEQTVPKKSIDALNRFKDNGGIFTFATGRDIMFIKRRFPFLIDLINAPAIMSNGALTYDFFTEQPLQSLTFKKDVICDVLTKVNERFPDAPFQVTLLNGFSVVNPDDYYFKRFEKLEDVVEYSNKFVVPNKEIAAVNFIDRDLERINKIAEFVESLDDAFDFEKVFSESFIYELLPKGATKGNAVNLLRNEYPGRKIVSAGDWYNDMSVLKSADIPVCPANAAGEIKDFCKHVLCHCNDGLINDIVNLMENESI